jgi:hypothetical protein
MFVLYIKFSIVEIEVSSCKTCIFGVQDSDHGIDL